MKSGEIVAVPNKRRLTVRQYLNLVARHAVTHWKAYTLPLAVVVIMQFFVRIDVNLTDSLPDALFVTVKGWKTDIKKGDYIAFEYQGTGPASPFPTGFHFVKIVGGTAGDTIIMDSDRNFYRGEPSRTLGADFLGHAKSVSKTGRQLEPGLVGRIPDGQYYVYAPHPDSLDSRYALTGWVKQEHVIGKTFALF